MIRKQRTQILIKGSAEVSVNLAQEILTVYEVKTLEEPNNSLVMVKVRESAQRSLFYLGEVLITECKVMIFIRRLFFVGRANTIKRFVTI